MERSTGAGPLDEASLEGGDFEAPSEKTKCKVDLGKIWDERNLSQGLSRCGGPKTEVTWAGLRSGRTIRTARAGEGDGDKSERRAGPLAWEWEASDKVVVKSSGKFRDSKRLSGCWTESGSPGGSKEGWAALAEMER